MGPHVNDLLSLLRSLDLAPAHLVGNSWGAFICLLAALKEPSATAGRVARKSLATERSPPHGRRITTSSAPLAPRLRRNSAGCFISPYLRHVFAVFSPFFSRAHGAGSRRRTKSGRAL